MRGSHVTRSLSQHATGPCHCGPEDFDPYMPHLQDHLGGHGSHGNHAYYPPGGPPQEPLPVRRLPSGYSGGTFPRSHPGQLPYDPAPAPAPGPGPTHHGHTSRKSQRAPPSQMEQFERQQLEGFHTLQYQRAGSGGEQRAERDRDRERAESPSRIRHLVHSVQRLFTKSHSLEAPAKQREISNGRERGGAPAVSGGGAHRHPSQPQRVPRSARRSKSHDRSKSRDSRHRGRSTGWWSSDDNLDSDSGYLQASRGRRGHQSLEGAVQDLTLRSLRAPPQLGPQGDCVSCTALALPGEGGLSLRKNPNAWAAMTVSHTREGYSALGHTPAPPMVYDKALVPLEGKPKERSFHYLQVPSEDWTGAYLAGASDSGGEIPCRRMRSGSYVRAMGDDDSVESDPSPTATPKTTLLSPTATPKTALLAQREAFRRSLSMDQRPIRYSCKQCSSAYANSRTMPKNHSCNHMQLGDSMCESVFGELGESQAVDALDLPGCFRARSHSYVRAIQAGVSHDDDCLPVFSLSGPQGGAKGAAVFPHKRKQPPPLPPRMGRPQLGGTAQSSTDSTQEAYFHSTGQPATRRLRQRSVDGAELGGGRTSRTGYYHQHSNSAESLDGPRGAQEGYFRGPGGGGGAGAVPMRPKHSSSAENLLESGGGGGGGGGGRGGVATLGKSISLPHNGKGGTRTPGDFVQDTHGRSWRPSIAVQVDSSETHSESDPESKALRAMQSIGVQVEDKRRERFRRSCSVMAGVQAELEREEHHGRGVASSHGSAPFQRHASEPEEICTIHTQGQWGYHDNYHHANNPRHAHANTPGQGHARAPMPGHDPEQGWASEGSHSLPGSARSSPFPRDGEFYLRMLHTEVERMERWCQRFEREAEEKDLPEEALTRIRSAVGNAQIFMSQKVQQFFRLCQQSLDPMAHPQPSPQDLAELWDLLQLAVEEVRLNFQELQRLKDSGWRLYPKDDKTLPPPLPKKPSGGVGAGRARGGAGGGPDPRGGVSRSEAPPLPAREKSVDLGTDSQDPHGRLLQAKRAAHSFRQNSATESADSIEIYIPEAQTRF